MHSREGGGRGTFSRSIATLVPCTTNYYKVVMNSYTKRYDLMNELTYLPIRLSCALLLWTAINREYTRLGACRGSAKVGVHR